MNREVIAQELYDMLPDGQKRLVVYDSFEAPKPIEWSEAKRDESSKAVVARVYETADRLLGGLKIET